MSAESETLREAAQLMRERASFANAMPSPWRLGPGPGVNDAEGDKVARVALETLPRLRTATASHIASWHPAVAFAVADWLEEIEVREAARSRANVSSPVLYLTEALTIARAYLGQAAS